MEHQSFAQALQRITQKLPPVLESTFTKKSSKETNSSYSEFILDNKLSFFTNKDEPCASGGFGKVKKGYHLRDTDKPRYGIKKFNHPYQPQKQQEAIREVKYQRLLGRESFYFTHQDKPVIVSEWQQGLSLEHYQADELVIIPLEKRLRCLSRVLSDLNTLHQNYRIHGDIKCQNCVLDLEHEAIRLIDFGTAHKKESTKSFGYTPAYQDIHIFGDHFGKDMYAMGLVTMYLFPELYTISFDHDKATFSMVKSDFSLNEQAIVTLVETMMNPEHDLRCTSEQALTSSVSLPR